jgi:hypothetical protein
MRAGRLPEQRVSDFHREPAEHFSFSSYSRVDWRRAVDEGADDLRDTDLEDALASLDEILVPAWSRTVSGGSRHDLVQRLLGRFAAQGLVRLDRLPATPEELVPMLAAELAKLRAFCAAEQHVAGYAMPLVGIEAAEPLTWLDDHVRLRAVDESYRHEIWQRTTHLDIASYDVVMEAHDLAQVGAQLEMVSTFGAGEQLDMRIVQHRWDDGLDAVRLSTPGHVFALCQYPIADEHEAYVSEVTMGGVMRVEARRPSAPGTRPVDGSLRDVWRRLTSVGGELDGREAARLDRARQRFRFAYDRRAAEDRLIDCWIALEALVLSDSTQELSYKAAMRIARLIGHDSAERLELFGRLKHLYSARSKVAHGSVLKDAQALADEAHEILRRVLVGWMSPSATRAPADMDGELLR